MRKVTPGPDFSWTELAKAFWWIIYSRRRSYITLSLALFIGYFTFIYPAFVTGRVVDELLTYKQLTQPLLILIASLVVVYGGAAVLRLELKKRLGNVRSDIMYDLRVKGFDSLLEQLFVRDTKELVGGKVQQLSNGIEQFKLLSKLLDNIISVGAATFIGISITFVFMVKWYFVAFLFLYLMVTIFITKYFTLKQLKIAEEFYKRSESTAGVFVEGISNALTVKAQGAKSQFQDRVSSHADSFRVYEYAGRKVGIFKWQVFQFINGITYGLFLFLSCYAAVRGEMSIGSVAIVGGYMMRIVASSSEFVEAFDDFIDARQGIARMMKIFWALKTPWPGKKPFPMKWKSLSFDKVTFSYPKSKSSVYDISFEVQRGSSVGLKGPTGSGKSTLAKLLIGLLTPHAGIIRIGDVNIQHILHDELLKHIAIVMQESELFAMTMRENITMLRDISDTHLLDVIRVSQLESLLRKLPAGLETMVGEKGYRLSGGERQRIAIARALCKSPDILVLDEATSSLDLKTEELLVKSIHETYPKLAILAIAHRPQALAYCKKIYEIKDGRLL